MVDGLPNCVAVDRSKLKHTIQTRVLFKNSRSCFSVLGSVVGTWCKFKSVAILAKDKRVIHKGSLTEDYENWPNCKTRVQPTSVFLPSPRRNRIYTHKYIRLAQLDWLPAINQGVSSRMFGKMHRYRIYFRFLCIKPWGYSTNCERQSTFDSNPSIKYKSSLLTDSKQEWASGKSRRWGMEHGVQKSNKGLRKRYQVGLSRRLPYK